jgi:flavin-dependent dehydrogenase
VVRSEFDQMLLENAREHGVVAHEGVRVMDVVFDPSTSLGAGHPRAVGVKLKDREVRAKVVVDASGQNGLIANRLGLRVWDPILNKGAIWSYFEGAYRDSGKDEGATMVLQTPDKQGWFWYIPQHDNIVSVGVVGPFDYLFKGRGKDFEKIFDEEVERTAAVKKRIEGSTRATGFFATKDYSYRTTKASGDGWVLVGDAWGFLDPLYSSGVLLALKSGQLAADAIVEGLKTGDTSAAQLGRWSETFNRGVDRMRRLVCEYYAGFSFGKFVHKHPDLRGTVTDLLIGDLFEDRVDKVWPPMEAMYPENRHKIPAWDAGTPVADAPEKANELFIPADLSRRV